MSAHNSSQTSLRQVYQDLMAGMTDQYCKVFMQMPRSSWVGFLNQLLPANSSQLRAQDCNTTVVGSKCGTIVHVEGEEEVDSIFAETEAPLIRLPCLGFEDLQDWSDDIVLKTASSLLETPSALFAKDKAVTPICSGAHYHGSYNVEQLIGEIDLCLHVTARDTSGFYFQHVYTITQCNQHVYEITCIWALEQSASPELPRTLGLDLQANTPHCFSLALCLFVQAVKDNLQLYLPLDVSVAHFMWYPPKACSSGAVSFTGCYLEHFCRLPISQRYSCQHATPTWNMYCLDTLL
ncbi:hypothetical protein DSO57_1001451 [Entomophthora muscae]|uniref:Uncharacterized protein n=1 Tax=Entomophthora muscae TaxID=34485 RepID=A0ACC2UID2_9FUNG|nr:hypothetical protein DSO57_1001451 [Entomophthora muscae]